MLTAELKVNGKPIGDVRIVHRLFIEDDLEGWCRYEYTLTHNGEVHQGKVTHERRDGAWELVARVVRDLPESFIKRAYQ